MLRGVCSLDQWETVSRDQIVIGHASLIAQVSPLAAGCCSGMGKGSTHTYGLIREGRGQLES